MLKTNFSLISSALLKGGGSLSRGGRGDGSPSRAEGGRQHLHVSGDFPLDIFPVSFTVTVMAYEEHRCKYIWKDMLTQIFGIFI